MEESKQIRDHFEKLSFKPSLDSSVNEELNRNRMIQEQQEKQKKE